MSTIEAQSPVRVPDEFENRQARIGVFWLVYAFAGSAVLYLIPGFFLAPSAYRLPPLAFGVIVGGAGLVWAIWASRVIAYKVRLTASGLDLTDPWGKTSRVSWPDIARIRQEGKTLFVYRREGRQVRIPDNGPFAGRVIETARTCGVTIDPPKPA